MTRTSLIGLLAASVLAVAVTTAIAGAPWAEEPEAADRAVVSEAPGKPHTAEVALAPSGLPVGRLESKVTRSGGDVAVSTVRLVVRPDDSGAFGPPGAHAGDGGGGYPVVFTARGPGRVTLAYDGVVCADPRALTLSFTVDAGVVTVTGAERHGCLVGTDLAADLVGATFRLQPVDTGTPAGE